MGVVRKQELILDKGWMNSAGILGFTPPFSCWQNQAPLAYLTPPLTEKPRPPAANRQVIRFGGGFLLYNGDYNPGLRAVLKAYADRWARSKMPVWVHLLLEDPRSAERMLAQVEGCAGVTAVEVSLLPELDGSQKAELLQSLRCELPLVLRVPLNQAMEEWVNPVTLMGFSGLTIGAPRGSLSDSHGGIVNGWIYAPALFPLALQALLHWQARGMPVILGCGVFRRQDVVTALELGAAAVQLDVILWHGGIF